MNQYNSISKFYKMVWHCHLADDFLWQNGELNRLSESGRKNIQIHALQLKQGKSKGNGKWIESTDIFPDALLFVLWFTQG